MPICGLSILLLRIAPGPLNLVFCLVATATVLLVCLVAYRTLNATFFEPLQSMALHLQRFMAGEALPPQAEWLLPQLQALEDLLGNSDSGRSMDLDQRFRALAASACLATSRRLIAFVNLMNTDTALRQEHADGIRVHAERMALLLGEVTTVEFTQPQEMPLGLLDVIDDTIAAYTTLNPGGIPVYVELAAPEKISATLDRHLFQALLLNLLWLAQSERKQQAIILLTLSATAEQVRISFENHDAAPLSIDLPARARHLLAKTEATWDESCLLVPAKQVHSTTQPQGHRTAAVIATTALEERTIKSRLAADGITQHTSPATADFCIISADDDHEVYGVLKQVRAFSTLLVVGASTLYALPNVRQLSSPIQQRELEQAIAALPTTRPEGPLALVVDDNLASLRLASIHLRNLGFESLTAQEGATAQELALAHPISVVLLDQHLPDTTGSKLAATLQEHKPELTIILMSADMDTADAQQALKHGVAAVLKKPLNPAAIAQSISRGATTIEPTSTGRVTTDPALLDQHFDAALSLELANHQADLANELLQELMLNIESEKRAIESAINSGDKTAAHDLLHRLRGGLQYCGVPRLRRAADKLAGAMRQQEDTAITDALFAFGLEVQILVDWYDERANYFGKADQARV